MNGQTQRHLEALLDRELDEARALAAVLMDERAALTGDAPQAVHQTAAEKVRLFAVMEALETERRPLWESLAGGAATLPAPLAERWRELMGLMAACRADNDVNGHIIHIRQNQIRQLIDIVRGGAQVTYGRQGKTYAKALRALARA
jgi:flagellar biosynthesis/type III secretory pathway chaperone